MTPNAGNCVAPKTPEPPEARLKLAVMDVINEGIRRRYPTLQKAAHSGRIDRVLLSRIRHGHYRRCSIACLFRVADRLGIDIKIDVRLA